MKSRDEMTINRLAASRKGINLLTLVKHRLTAMQEVVWG